MGDFKLSAQLSGHDSDVKAVSFPSKNTVLTTSRDGSVRIWNRSTDTSPPSYEPTISSQTSEFVNAVAYLPASDRYPKGLIVSGGKDTFLDIRQPDAPSTQDPDRLLIGHSQNVCSLDVSPTGNYIVSGGWDFKALVWNTSTWENEVALDGHEKAVWAVLAWDEHTVLTGCADGNIRIFDVRKAVAGLVDAQSTISTSDVVRALCRVPKGHPSGADIASASNDGIIRLWKLNGQQVGELSGHENFIYSLQALPSGELISSGEDRTVRVWRGEECVQTITHPAISVWAIAVSQESGDIVSGASDGVARVFTRDSKREADAATIAQFQDSIKASAIPKQQLPDINKEKLPGPDFLKQKSGTKEGQVVMINEGNGNIGAYQWSQSQSEWISVGTVVDSAGSSGRKTEYNGKSYDYVFDVDIEDGKPPLKLPYNLSQNPYEAATKFLGDNELPITYLDSVANFITQNTQGASLGQSGSSAPDPHGTDSRYQPGQSEDTGPKVLPQNSYLSITAAKYDAMINKIIQLNTNMVQGGRKDISMNPDQEKVLKDLRTAVERGRPVQQEGLDLVVRLVKTWPYTDRLPVLDLLRCMVPSPLVAGYAPNAGSSILEIAINSATDSPTPNENSVMMALRAIANIFSTPEGRKAATRQASQVIDFLDRVVGVSGETPIGASNRNVQIALATVLINYGVLAHKDKGMQLGDTPDTCVKPDVPRRFLIVISKVLTQQSDSEVLYRALVALGTMSFEYGASARASGGQGWVNTAKGKASEQRVKDVANEVLERITR